MATRRNTDDEGRRLGARLRSQIGDEIRRARLSSGLSQRVAGASAAMSHAQLGRIERGELEDLTIDQVCRAGIAVGLRFAGRMYPDGDPVRDAAHLRLLDRFRALAPAAAGWRTEVPLPIVGDRRAWDAVLRVAGRRAGCEAETRLDDLQALERRLALKLRDGDVDILLLVVSDTAHNRRILDVHRDALRALLPLDGRHVLRAFRDARLPEANGLVVT